MRPPALIASAVLLAALTGCGSTDDTSGTLSPNAIASIEAESGFPPKPDSETQARFITALNSIDGEIVTGKEMAVDWARSLCSMVKDRPNDQAKLVDLTNQRFRAPGHLDGFGKAKATKILAAVRKYICPTY
ncbi:hypothetical protein [Microbispora bryophytorum]|uniref:hypothetical protein n=1 Tax=Microbispora bryophytorum TaxID=1460882 RepID=UPI0033EE6415